MRIIRFLSISFCFCMFLCSVEAKKKRDFVLCTWNIGHFSNGSKPYSLIKPNSYEESLRLYRSFLYNEISPDVICVNEYNRVFSGEGNGMNSYLTSSLLFNEFKRKFVGSSLPPICNALFSNIRIRKPRIFYFESLNRPENGISFKIRDNYYIETDLYLSGNKVKLVFFHLLYLSEIPETLQRIQIQELVEMYDKTDKVILCGDWNTGKYSLLKDAGYVLANDGSFKTYPSKGYPLDNIAVKGMEISDVRMINTNLSDHNPLVCRISLNN